MFTCPFCGKIFNNLKSLDKHLLKKHGKKVELMKMEHPEKSSKPISNIL